MGQIKVSDERKAEVFRYLDSPPTQRQGIRAFRKGIHMGPQTYRDLKSEWENTRRDENDRALGIARQLKVKMERDNVDATEISGEEVLMLKRKSYNEAMKIGSTKADRELAAKMLGLLVDKQEITHHLSPELIEKSRKRADIELKETGGIWAVENIPDKPPELIA